MIKSDYYYNLLKGGIFMDWMTCDDIQKLVPDCHKTIIKKLNKIRNKMIADGYAVPKSVISKQYFKLYYKVYGKEKK